MRRDWTALVLKVPSRLRSIENPRRRWFAATPAAVLALHALALAAPTEPVQPPQSLATLVPALMMKITARMVLSHTTSFPNWREVIAAVGEP